MELAARAVTLPLGETFVIARGAQDEVELLEVEIRHGDVRGFGQGAPIERYGESVASGLAWLEGVAPGPCVSGTARDENEVVVVTAVGYYGNVSAVVLKRA